MTRRQCSSRPAGTDAIVPRVKDELPSAVQVQPFGALEVGAGVLGKGDRIRALRLCGKRAGEECQAGESPSGGMKGQTHGENIAITG